MATTGLPQFGAKQSSPAPSEQQRRIKHLVVLMLCSRSFDHMLGFLKSDRYPVEGLTGDEANLDSTGEQVKVSNDAE